jgi:hypothetical protein
MAAKGRTAEVGTSQKEEAREPQNLGDQNYIKRNS